MNKTCRDCHEQLPQSGFTKAVSNTDGLLSICKKCVKQQDRGYHRRKDIIYKMQRANSKRRGHPMPIFTKQALMDWLEQKGYAHLHATWVGSNYVKRLTPSVDRLDDSLPYSFDNMRLVTWGLNDDKAHNDFKTGKLLSTHTPINQLTKEGVFIKKHVSQTSAARELNTSQGNIGAACKGIRKSAGGYKWEFV